MNQSIYKRSKNVWNNEQEAQADVCVKQNRVATELQPKHTDTNWVWTAENGAVGETTAQPSYSKKLFSEQEAKRYAMEHLQTFENNLQAHHTDENWVFGRIRG